MKPLLLDIAHDIAREQIAWWKSQGWSARDAAAALNMKYSIEGWRDVENALSMAWRRLQKERRFENYQVAA